LNGVAVAVLVVAILLAVAALVGLLLTYRGNPPG
jgi:hypothetical protein